VFLALALIAKNNEGSAQGDGIVPIHSNVFLTSSSVYCQSETPRRVASAQVFLRLVTFRILLDRVVEVVTDKKTAPTFLTSSGPWRNAAAASRCLPKIQHPYHRLFLAISIYDVLESMMNFASTWPIPKGTEGV
jgi:hypothetical protein